MRVRGRRASTLLLGLFVSLSIVALATVTPVQAAKPLSPATGNSGGGTTYSCSVSVTYSPGSFTVATTITATGGSLPGPTETDYVSSYKNGVLYDSQSSTNSVGRNTATFTFNVPVPSDGAGAYTFQSTILNSKGSQLATCTGTYSL